MGRIGGPDLKMEIVISRIRRSVITGNPSKMHQYGREYFANFPRAMRPYSHCEFTIMNSRVKSVITKIPLK